MSQKGNETELIITEGYCPDGPTNGQSLTINDDLQLVNSQSTLDVDKK